MKDAILKPKSPFHHGVIFDSSRDGFDSGAASFGSIFVDEDNPDTLYLFYSGAEETMAHWAIGLAKSRDGFKFERVGKVPILEGGPAAFCHKEAMAPAVTRISNRFYMVFSGKPSSESFRRLGIAYADDPEGSWNIIGELVRPTSLWEGLDIDNGPSIVNLDKETILVFYSSITSWRWFDIFTILRRYPVRRIGIAKVRIRGPSMSSIEVYKSPRNPLKHLNGPKGSWNESLFCPGYFKIRDEHCLLPAASIYSKGSPYNQYIGIVKSNSPYFQKATSNIEKLIDGPLEKSLIIPTVKGEIALDTPSPLLEDDGETLRIYYAVMDRADGAWKIALSTFKLRVSDERR